MGLMWQSHSLSADMYISAYIHVLLRDQPLQHRKRCYTRVWRLWHPIVELGSAIQRIMSNSFAYRHTSERICSTIQFGVPTFISFVLLFSNNLTIPIFLLNLLGFLSKTHSFNLI